MHLELYNKSKEKYIILECMSYHKTTQCFVTLIQELVHFIQGGPKKVYDVVQRKSVWEILKYFLMESFSLYIYIFSRSLSFLSYVEKKLWGSKNPENGLFLAS